MMSTQRGRGQAQVDACGRGEDQAPCGRPHRKLKLQTIDVILSSHAKKLESFFYQNFVFVRNKKWKFFGVDVHMGLDPPPRPHARVKVYR